MIKKISLYFSRWFYAFLELQLVISLMSLPILTYWGLPISYMSPLANMIFTPLLILFLWISCLFSICALTHMPCSWFVYALDYITSLWNYLLSLGRPEWLIGFSHQTIWVSLLSCIIVFYLYTYIKPPTKQAVCFLLILWLCLILTQYYAQKNNYKKIKDLPLIALQINNKTYLIDYGALCMKQNFYTYIDYTILPMLIKTTGITTVDTLILCKPSSFLAKATHQFALQTNLKTIIVTTKSNCFNQMKTMFQNSNITIIPLEIQKIKKSMPQKSRKTLLRKTLPRKTLQYYKRMNYTQNS